MTPQHVDTNLVSDVHSAQFEYLRGRMSVMRDVRRDPNATCFFEAEHLRACIAPGIPNPFFNQVFISGPAELQDVESALALFEQHGMKPQLDVGPSTISSALARFLSQRGFVHTQSYPVLIQRDRDAAERPGSEILVARVESVAALELFKDVYVRGWQVEAWLAPSLQSYMDHWLGVPGWTLYLASQQNVPIGIGILFEHSGVAYLADAATTPGSRTRGAQSALIARRIADAWQNAAPLVFSRAEFGSTSLRNLERAGFESRYAAAIWRKE